MTRAMLVFALLAALPACNAVVGTNAVAGTFGASCTRTRAFDKPWQELSDAELRIEIERACGRVFIGFKEEGTLRGVDPQGRSVTGAETVARMKAYLAEREITIEWSAIDLPAVSARMPAQLTLVSEVRGHPNVDYLEPIFPGTRWGQ